MVTELDGDMDPSTALHARIDLCLSKIELLGEVAQVL